MYAVIKTGGKQYRVEKGDEIKIERLDVKEGKKVDFDQVLALGEGTDIKIGTPYVDGAVVTGKVIENGKDKKVIIFKYKAKKDYRKKQGHRQPFTLVKIDNIKAEGASKPEMPKKETVKADDKPAKKAEETKKDEIKQEKKPSLKSMKKAELIAYAKENSIDIDEKATNAVMIETIEKAMK